MIKRDKHTGRYLKLDQVNCFWSHLSKDGPVMREDLGRCWIWFDSTHSTGYGQFRQGTAHAYSYKLHKGPIPNGKHIDHLCRIRCCVNPDHLEAVDPRENLARGNSWNHSGMFQTKTHCKRGHLLAGKNIRIHKDGERECLLCSRPRKRRWQLEKSRQRENHRQNVS